MHVQCHSHKLQLTTRYNVVSNNSQFTLNNDNKYKNAKINKSLIGLKYFNVKQ